MADAVVNIVLKPGTGEDLIADCKATFTLETGQDEPGKDRDLLVAFPLSGQNKSAVQIVDFTALIDGARPDKMIRRPIRFTVVQDASPTWDLAATFDNIAEGKWHLVTGDLEGGNTYLDAYYWRQSFRPNSRSIIDVAYHLTLRPQSLQYVKKYMHGEPLGVVPFDLMWAGQTDERAYFFDYILRSGATWSGPIGHEIVTLTIDPALHLDLDDIIVLPRNIAALFDEDTREARGYLRAGIYADGASIRENRIVWEIKNEKPTKDIIVEIPFHAVHRTLKEQKR